jgi:AraC-like DNA-binding protein
MELIKSRKHASIKRTYIIVESNSTKGNTKIEVVSEYALFKTIKTMLKQCNEKTDISITATTVLENIELSFSKREKKMEKRSYHQPSCWKHSELSINSSEEKFLLKLQELIKSNINNSNLSVEFLSETLGVSRVQMYRKCMTMLDISPINYIKKLRIEYAAALLKQNKFRISEIAYNSGFSDPHYFSLCFTKELGSTPSRWLKNMQYQQL